MGDNSELMVEFMRTPKPFLVTKHAIYPLITGENPPANEVRKGTAFATKLSAPSNDCDSVMILAINPCNQADNNANYFTRLSGSRSTEKLDFVQRQVNSDTNLLLHKPTDQVKSRLRKTLKPKVDDRDVDRVGLIKIYVAKNTGSKPKKFKVEKGENGSSYKLKDTKHFGNNNALPVGAPVLHCTKRFFGKSTKKVIGMVKSIGEDGTLSVWPFNADLIMELFSDNGMCFAFDHI